MNLKNINYGINIIYNNANRNLNKIINELDSKFIKYEINNEIDNFINVKVVSQQNKIKFFVEDIEYKTDFDKKEVNVLVKSNVNKEAKIIIENKEYKCLTNQFITISL